MWTILIKDVCFYNNLNELVLISQGQDVYVDVTTCVALFGAYHFEIQSDEFLYYH
jgi:hypothetical protein